MTAVEYLRFLVSALVSHAENIEIEEKKDELGTLLSLKVDLSDM